MESASWPKTKCKCSYIHFYKVIQETFVLETDYFHKHMAKKKNYSLSPLF
jgi:hypothetical protein